MNDTHQFMFEEDWGKMELNGPKKDEIRKGRLPSSSQIVQTLFLPTAGIKERISESST